jgi:hypothetical protein
MCVGVWDVLACKPMVSALQTCQVSSAAAAPHGCTDHPAQQAIDGTEPAPRPSKPGQSSPHLSRLEVSPVAPAVTTMLIFPPP